MKPNAYYKFIVLPEEVRQGNNIQSNNRLDCIEHWSNGYRGIKPFIVPSTKQFHLRFVTTSNFVRNTTFEETLTSRGMNVSSLMTDCDDCNIAYGFPSKQIHLRSGKLNPLRDFKDDGYIFIYNQERTVLELLIFIGGRPCIEDIYYEYLSGTNDYGINEVRDKAVQFYDYYWYKTSTQTNLFTEL